MSAEKPRVEGMCMARSQWVNRAIGEHACAATQQDPEQPERTLRCPVKAIVHGDIDQQATADANRGAGYAEDDPRYTQLHRTTVERDTALLGEENVAPDCLTLHEGLPDIRIQPY